MAELQTADGGSRTRGSRHRSGSRRSKKLSTRVDLTPMVDLGFLLITFFFVSTTWSKPHAAHVILPANGDSMSLGKTPALTVVAVDPKRVFYYNGDLASSLLEGTYGITDYSFGGGIGSVIQLKQRALDRTYKGGRKEMMLLIKSFPEANYKNLVSLLDQPAIHGIIHYAILDLPESEKALIRVHSAKSP